jgi:hypothetical protein
MANLAIKGHPTRGRDVIEILEMLGGLNVNNYKGNGYSRYYIITNNYIDWCHECIPESNFISFTLEDFLEKFPYKVGDKVLILANTNYVYTIKSMTWDTDQVKYKIKAIDDIENEFYWLADELLYYTEQKEESMENKGTLVEIDLTREESKAEKIEVILGDYEFLHKDGKTYFVKKKPKYPKTYEECCKVLNLTKYPPALVPNKSMFISQYEDFPHYYEIQKFAQLLVCRDAYWKIAGEQMGLGKPWEPDFTNNDEERYGIYTVANKVVKDFCGVGDVNMTLTFPTEEMRDAFKENFDELIEECKELL